VDGLRGGDFDQPARKPFVADLAGAKLLFGPAVAVEAVVRLDGGPGERIDVELRVNIGDQRIKINVLAGFAGVMRAVAPTALGLADLDPVGRFVTDAFIGGRIDEALHQPGTQAVAALEIRGDAACAKAEHVRGEIRAAQAGPDEKTGHVDEPGQMGRALGVAPAQMRVAPLQIQRCAAEADAAEPAVLGADQVAELTADQPGVVQGVLPNHQFVPDEQMFARVHLQQFQSFELGEFLGHAAGGGDTLGQARGRTATDARARAGGRRQRPVARRFEFAQRSGGGGDLPVAFGIAQVQPAAELFGQCGARGLRLRAEQLAHQHDRVRLGQALFNGRWRVHPPAL